MLARLLEMPKPKVRDIAVSVTTQWKYVLLGASLFPAAAGVFYLLSIYGTDEELWTHWALATLAIGVTPAFIGAGMAIWVWTQNRKLKRLTNGEYFVHWTIGEEQWSRVCQHLERKFLWAPPIMAVSFLFVGLVFGGLAYDDGNIFFGSVAAHFAGLSVIFTAIGAVIGGYIWFLAGVTRRLMRTRTPQVVIGPTGLYYTAHYWPASTLSQRMVSVKPCEEIPDFLSFRFSTQTNHGIHQVDVQVPHPPEEAATARLVCALMNREIRR